MSGASAGLRFRCTRCGDCCTGPPGFVWVGPEDAERIAAHLGHGQDEFRRRYTREVDGRRSLIEKPGGDCVFLTRSGGKSSCSIHPVKPLQCRTWPFWTDNLRTKARWESAGRMCPGMDHGPRYDFVAIEELRLAKPE